MRIWGFELNRNFQGMVAGLRPMLLGGWSNNNNNNNNINNNNNNNNNKINQFRDHQFYSGGWSNKALDSKLQFDDCSVSCWCFACCGNSLQNIYSQVNEEDPTRLGVWKEYGRA